MNDKLKKIKDFFISVFNKNKDILDTKELSPIKKIVLTISPFLFLLLVALLGWRSETISFFEFLAGKLFESFYALTPFVILAAISYGLFYFPAHKLHEPRKTLFLSLGRSLALILFCVGFIRSLVYWGVENNTLVHSQIALFIFAPFLLGSYFIRFVFEKISIKMPIEKKGLYMMLSRTLSFATLLAGAISALSKMGYNVQNILASLGLTGLVIGLAIKDTISNTISGLLIIIFEPFRVGDYIKFYDKQGVVEKIDLKNVTVREDAETVHILPNGQALGQVISVKRDAKTNESIKMHPGKSRDIEAEKKEQDNVKDDSNNNKDIKS